MANITPRFKRRLLRKGLVHELPLPLRKLLLPRSQWSGIGRDDHSTGGDQGSDVDGIVLDPVDRAVAPAATVPEEPQASSQTSDVLAATPERFLNRSDTEVDEAESAAAAAHTIALLSSPAPHLTTRQRLVNIIAPEKCVCFLLLFGMKPQRVIVCDFAVMLWM